MDLRGVVLWLMEEVILLHAHNSYKEVQTTSRRMALVPYDSTFATGVSSTLMTCDRTQ